MSRHRNFRNRSESYGEVEAHSDAEEVAMTAEEEAYLAPAKVVREQSVSLLDFAKPKKTKGKKKGSRAGRSGTVKRNPEKELMDTKVREVVAVIGEDAFPRSRIESTLRKVNYNTDFAVDRLLNDTAAVVAVAQAPETSQEGQPAEGPVSTPATPAPETRSPVQPRSTSALLNPSSLLVSPALARARSTESVVSSVSSAGGRASVGRSAKQQRRAESLLAAAEGQAAEEGRESLNLVVVGHVDAGKSTLMGQTLVSLGLVSKQQAHKLQREAQECGKGSFALAWVMDEHSGERERGVTIDVGMNAFNTRTKHVTLLDAPGHKDFVPSMITGAAQADAAVLVVASQRGDFESGFCDGGQTKEHAILVRSLGVSQLIVAVNKMDTIDWAQDRFEEVRATLSDFLAEWNFKPDKVVFVPCSGFSGDNVTKRCTAPEAGWYTGPTLVEAIDSMSPSVRPVGKPLRAVVTDVFPSMALGTTVGCKVETGFVVTKDKVVLMPSGLTAVVRGIERAGQSVDVARAGDNVEIGVTDVDADFLTVGQILCHPTDVVPVTNRFKARVQVFPGCSVPIIKGSGFILHHQSINEPAIITKLVESTNLHTGKTKKKPRVVSGGQTALVHIRTPRPLCIEEFSKLKRMGRFMLRYRGETIAAGQVTELREKKE